MKRSAILFLILLLHSLVSVGQDIFDREELFLKNLNSLYQDPDQSIRVANFLLSNAKNEIEKSRALYLLAESEKLKGEHSRSIKNLYLAKQAIYGESNPYLVSLILISISERCRISGMDDISKNYLKEAEIISRNITSQQQLSVVNCKILLEQTERLVASKQLEEALQTSIKAEKVIKPFEALLPVITATVKNEIGNIYLETDNISKATDYYQRALSVVKKSDLENSSVAAVSLFGMGKVSSATKNLQLAEDYYKRALAISTVEEEQTVQITKELSEVYKTMDSLSEYRKYYSQSSELSSSISASERKVRNTILSQIEKEQAQQIESKKGIYFILGGVLIALVLLSGVLYYFYNKRLDKEYARFKEVISKIEREEKLQTEEAVEKEIVPAHKKIVIPESTERAILERLEDFEQTTKFIDANMSLQLLAKQMKTNTKYISEIIRKYKNKNFNTYINELRVNYIIHLMKTDKKYLAYKVSYLAESCGFSSHSAFTVVFKSITGITPKQFITFLKKSSK
ncbi:helix-turn-helix domain-containing protein [Ulvibacter litoralis]|nr:helix-turn-helix domain-containing protein [Ulvibacter litoralis]GHC53486.1 transcriptional regulator [Ulvibacter litoralis]